MTQTFTINRTFDAPRDVMWQAWTDPARFSKWFGPKGFTCRIEKYELRAGGVVHSYLRSPDGAEMWGKFVYREVTPPSRLVWVHSFADAQGNTARHPMHESWPLELLANIVFEEQGNKTKLTLSWVPLNATETEVKTFEDNMASMQQGWGGTFDQLAAYLAGA